MSSSIEIINSTDYSISGEISYMTVFCSNKYFFAKPDSYWKSEKYGICPVVEVSAIIKTPRGTFVAKPYLSRGTSHSLFEVAQVRENIFVVRRLTKPDAEKSLHLNAYNSGFLKKM